MKKQKLNQKTITFFDKIYTQNSYLESYQTVFNTQMKYDLKLGLGSSKGSIFYNTHSYPTKVPVDNIVKRILSNTKQNQNILDPFCGSGMTGLAAKLTGRNAYLSDIGSLAIHLSANHVAFCDHVKLKHISDIIIEKLKHKSPYFAKIDGTEREISYLVFADIFSCEFCSKQISAWEVAKQSPNYKVPSIIKCPNCNRSNRKSNLKAVEKRASLAGVIKTSSRLELKEIENPIERTRTKISSCNSFNQIANTPFDANREMHIRSALHLQNVTKLRDFYSDTNWLALTSLYQEITQIADQRIQAALMLAFTNTAWHGTKMRRYNSKGGHRPLTGTLYFPQLYSEGNVYQIFANKIDTLYKYFSSLNQYSTNSLVKLNRNSATSLKTINESSIDYIYTDPPFGANIFYADCNFIAEAWLGNPTSIVDEAVVNKSLKSCKGGKDLDNYSNLMTKSFEEMNRVLKRNGCMSLVFNSSSGAVWQALMDSLSTAGFELTNASLLDKVQLSFKGYKSRN